MVGRCFQINDWMLSVDENKLYRQNREVSVEPRLINLLYFLAKNAGEVFGREELIEHVWGGAIVTDQVVTQSIFELRKLLRDGREENISYLTTVPKRGYKLVATVTEVFSDPVHQLQEGDLSPPITVDDARAIEQEGAVSSSDITFPAAPLTRAFQFRCTTTKDHHTAFKRWRTLIFDVLWISVLIIGFGLFTYHQSDISITQAVDTRLIEFRFDHGFSQHEERAELADGMVQKLAADISQVTHYRIRLSKARFASGILPGKTVTVLVKEQEGKAYLDLEYRNNASGTILFSRQYLLVPPHLNRVLKQVSLDLMQALQVVDAQSHVEQLMADLPVNHQTLSQLIRAHHYLNTSQPESFQRGIQLLEQVLRAEPDNRYVQAELLVAYYVQVALALEQALAQDRINQLTYQLINSTQLADVDIQGRIVEALALHEIVSNRPEQAHIYLQQAFTQRESVLGYVLRGKLFELNGDMEAASDAYSEAFYIDTSLETYLLCENLAFYSNLKSIDYALYRSVHPSVTTVL
ncbi:lysine decarboxylation/transport transcriptional activator CadC [Vibrio fujianensis]|uniref:lysine decarboxylation/transport transcriptional activator CadC n=1 Tax=Vibrio fujianensis TaxID=1974215 RepID=UPI000C16E0DE|nr:lysine decarboxylation/transport transcriptional activator CadC [Vibrio fujianensis]